MDDLEAVAVSDLTGRSHQPLPEITRNRAHHRAAKNEEEKGMKDGTGSSGSGFAPLPASKTQRGAPTPGGLPVACCSPGEACAKI